MIAKSAIAAVSLIAAGNAVAEPRLQGTWRSDARLSIESIETVRDLTNGEREDFEGLFGKMTMSFGAENVVVDWGEPGSKVMTVPYRTLETGSSHVTVEFRDPQVDSRETVTYEFEGDCIKRKLFPEGWFEYFCRVQ